ncbi:Beta-sarcoglycan [Stylophora pistillata]|uniref:Beta-sarcoglycan n=1 Tax=Stylophora pistillata TaxID=50429 RepID=A0A2B4SFD1_STYPI|nr:Beta-sarcoglycan [Stylophora pistillata]
MSRENLHRRENSKSRTSMREKLVEKQKATDEHESNFTAGRVNVRERYLHRTGIRGRKSWIFYAVLYILALIVIVNIVMLAILYHVLQMSKDGMKCLSFFENDNVRFHCISDLDSVNLYANQTGTFKDHNLVIDSDDEKVVSNEDQNLMLTSEQEILVEGHEGLGLDGKMIHINADEDVEISSTSGVQGNSLFKIMLDAGSGVHVAGSALDMVMPTGAPGSVLGKHKLCACINTGKLYRVAVVNTTFSTCSTVKNVCG